MATLIALTGLSACTSDAGGARSASPAPATTTAAPTPLDPGPIPPLPQVGAVPVEHDAGYADAVATFGSDQVAAAVTADAQIAHLALADCWRWTRGTIDPWFTALLAPDLLRRVLDELARSEGYLGETVPSLLSPLPEDDGNGHDEAAAVAGGCDDSAPLRFGPWPTTVAVHRSTGEPLLLLTGGFVLDVRLGSTRVQAGQDWRFTSQLTDEGWRLTNANPGGRVNWAPPLPE
jgi:hypothetical protein